MTTSKISSPLSWLSRRVDLKVLTAIFVVAVVFIPVTGFLSYQHAVTQAYSDAEEQVDRLVKIVDSNAATAAYLNDKQLAEEVLYSLKTAPVIDAVRITLSSQQILAQGEPFGKGDKTFSLISQFSSSPVGSLEVVLSHRLINQQVRNNAIFMMAWQFTLLITILSCTLIIFRWFVGQRLSALMTQVQQVKIDGDIPLQVINVSGNDEISYLANHTNQMIKQIHGLYRHEAARNLQIAELEHQFRMIFENSHAGIALINRKNQIFLFNHSFEHLFSDDGLSPTENNYLPELFAEPYEVEDILNQVRVGRSNLFKDFCLRRGQELWVRVLFSVVEDQSQNLNQLVELVAYDITDRTKQEQMFAYNATHDALTGLYNRRGAELKFKEKLVQAKRDNSHFIMALLDLNDFKPVNDQYGHDAGDVVLKEVASRLLGALRADDIIVRWGGDEFVVAFVLNDLQRLQIILDSLQQAFVAPIEISSDITVKVGASIGVSHSDVAGYELERLLEIADATMYDVKRSDKGRYRVATKSSVSTHA